MWTIGDSSSELIAYLCSVPGRAYDLRDALIKPALTLAVGLGIWTFEYLRHRTPPVPLLEEHATD